jgi:hypothetical protein
MWLYMALLLRFGSRPDLCWQQVTSVLSLSRQLFAMVANLPQDNVEFWFGKLWGFIGEILCILNLPTSVRMNIHGIHEDIM